MDTVTKKKCIFALAAYCLLLRKRKFRNRRLYIRNILKNRPKYGEMKLVRELADDPSYHFNYFRMSRSNFEEILCTIGHALSHSKTHAIPIGEEERLAMTLRYLAGGSSQRSIGFNYRISPAAVGKILRETMRAIWDHMRRTHVPTPTLDTLQKQAMDFFAKWNFPHCGGAADGKHVKIQAPANTGSDFFNYKNFFSIVLLAIVDANYRFSIVDIGAKGSQSDSGILGNSVFGRKLYSDNIDFPPPSKLPGSDVVAPYFFIGDDAFPLRTNLMKPYPGKGSSIEQRVFNYRLSRARRIVKNAFGIWAARFRVFFTTINADLELADLIVKSTVVLHNFLISKKDLGNLTMDTETNGMITEGNWREMNMACAGLEDLPRCASNNYTKDAAKVRDVLKDYFNCEEGSVSWQYDAINLFDQ